MMSDDGPGLATYSSGQQVLMLPYYAMHIIDAVLCIECSIYQMSLSSITHCGCASRPPKQTSVAEDTLSHLNALAHPPAQSSSCSATLHTVTTLHGISPIPLCWWKISNSRLLCSLTQKCLLAIGENPKHFSTHSLCIGGTRHCPLSHPRPWVLAKQLL